jgi:Fe-S-cluster containining protein
MVTDKTAEHIRNPQPACRRCGICCRKGGPALHISDLPLFDKKVLRPAHLFTIRKGEPVLDNVQSAVMPADAEMVKIQGKSGSWTCRFFIENPPTCSIHADRPAECRALNCRDTTAIEAMYRRERINRRHLIPENSPLHRLIRYHEVQIPPEAAAAALMGEVSKNDPEAAAALKRLIARDAELRRLSMEKGGLAAELLDFVFGHPLSVIVTRLKAALFPETGTAFLTPFVKT